MGGRAPRLRCNYCIAVEAHCYQRVRRASLSAYGIARHSLEHGRTQKRPKRAQHWARNTAQHLNIHNTASDTGHVTLGT